MVAGTAASAVAGGGGKFENGAVTGAFAYALGSAMRPDEAANDNWDTAKGKLAGGGTSDAWNDPLAQAVRSKGFMEDALDVKLQFEKCVTSGQCEYAATILFPAARIGGKGLQLLRGFGNIGGGEATVATVLRAAERWLGRGYREISPGVYRSANGTRQFRMTNSDLVHARHGSHVHFEAIGADGRTIIENSHVRLIGP